MSQPTPWTADALLEQLPVGILILKALRDESYRVIDFECESINRHAAHALGPGADALQGARLTLAAPTRFDPSQIRRLERVLGTQQPTTTHLPSLRDERHVIQARAQGSGDRLLISMTYEADGSPPRERSVDIPNLYGPDSGLLELILDFLPNPVFAKDKDHRWIFGNDEFARLVGQPVEQLLGKSDYDFFPRHQADIFWRKDQEVFESQDVVQNEEPITDASGKERWLLTRKIAKNGPYDEPVLLGVIADITSRKDTERALIESVTQRDHALLANQAKSQFLTRMSHELRTPLNAIIGYSELIREEAHEAGMDLIAQDIARVLTSAQHLLTMVNDTLDLARIERSGLRYEPSTFPLGALTEELTRRLQPQLSASGNTLQIVHQGDPQAMMTTDRGKLEAALLHLLHNADKFTRQGLLQLLIHAQPEPDVAWRFEVEDQGVGIEPERMSVIFDAFYQGIDAAAPHRGLGLGLPLARAYVTCLGGKLGARSELGRGSVFWITLPAQG